MIGRERRNEMFNQVDWINVRFLNKVDSGNLATLLNEKGTKKESENFRPTGPRYLRGPGSTFRHAVLVVTRN